MHRFLARLLLVHGSLSHYRLARLIKYSFYKNILFCFMLFFYQFYCGFSGKASTAAHGVAASRGAGLTAWIASNRRADAFESMHGVGGLPLLVLHTQPAGLLPRSPVLSVMAFT